MEMNENARQRLQDAINQVRADLKELEAHVPAWISESTQGTKRYRPLAKQIVNAAQRLERILSELKEKTRCQVWYYHRASLAALP